MKDGLIAFPGGTSYRLLVLPQVETMTPGLLAKIRDLVKAGATVVGTPPVKSPESLGLSRLRRLKSRRSPRISGGAWTRRRR